MCGLVGLAVTGVVIEVEETSFAFDFTRMMDSMSYMAEVCPRLYPSTQRGLGYRLYGNKILMTGYDQNNSLEVATAPWPVLYLTPYSTTVATHKKPYHKTLCVISESSSKTPSHILRRGRVSSVAPRTCVWKQETPS